MAPIPIVSWTCRPCCHRMNAKHWLFSFSIYVSFGNVKTIAKHNWALLVPYFGHDFCFLFFVFSERYRGFYYLSCSGSRNWISLRTPAVPAHIPFFFFFFLFPSLFLYLFLFLFFYKKKKTRRKIIILKEETSNCFLLAMRHRVFLFFL